MRRFSLGFLAAVLFAFSLDARAQAPAPPQAAPPAPAPIPARPPGYHTHDGFFLQMNLGLGAMNSKASQDGFSAELSGGAGEFGIALGYALTPSFIIAGDLWGVSVPDPTVKFNGTSVDAGDTTYGLSAIGVNLTYYFMPHNFYVTVVPSIGALTAESGGTSSDTESGFAIRLAVGKEWWVSDNWGLGLNLQYAHSSKKDSPDSGAPTWGTNWFGVAFSATYN
jgi:hypothetical protein